MSLAGRVYVEGRAGLRNKEEKKKLMKVKERRVEDGEGDG